MNVFSKLRLEIFGYQVSDEKTTFETEKKDF